VLKVKKHSVSKSSHNKNGHNGFMDLSITREQDRLDNTSQHYLRVIAESKKEMNRVIKFLLNPSVVDEAEIIKEQNEKNALVIEVNGIVL
jgi:hypothetical protein